MTQTQVRPLRTIAAEIRTNWPKVNYAAEPYLAAMSSLDSIHDSYYADDADTVVRSVDDDSDDED